MTDDEADEMMARGIAVAVAAIHQAGLGINGATGQHKAPVLIEEAQVIEKYITTGVVPD